MNINKILFLLLSLLLIFSIAKPTFASGNSLYISPAASTVNSGSPITANVMASTSGDKICAVQGTIAFNNMACQSITVSSGLMAQTQPTCSNPTFVIGIPKCITSNASLFTIAAKAGNAGTGSIAFSGVDIIGSGASVGNTSTSGNYTINALPVVVKNEPKEGEPEKRVEKNTSEDATETTVEDAPTETDTEINMNQTASISGAKETNVFFSWVWKNIVWMILIIIAFVAGYIVGKMNCKIKNKSN